MKLNLPPSVSFIRYWNDGKHVEFYYSLIGFVAGVFLMAGLFEPMLLFSSAGAAGVAIAAMYQKNDTLKAAHYLFAAIWAIPIMIFVNWWSLVSLAILGACIATKRSYYLFAFEVALFLTFIILNL